MTAGDRASRGARQASRDPLSREQIIDAALAFVDERGLDALTMRALAQELGVYPTALYWHVGTKAQLLSAVSARIFEEVALPGAGELPWDAWLAMMARQCRAAIHRHPNLAPIVGSHLVVTTTAIPLVERVIVVLEGAGLAGEELLHVYNSLIGFVLGWVTLELSIEPADAEEGWKDDFARQLRSLDEVAFPALTRNMSLMANNAFMTRWDSGRAKPMDRSFDAALDLLVRGVRASLR
ncbi:TetR/AcrR family transcriptional regulator C-terminal domain-containing protein [Nonomuraea lactucae]|uniref:TetR/AcrR family transcriptional regulator C-terminal domain-containing protein n=1 Tax=Nonomuraea lactucae TaxID=2249762 RepID=UPI000DE4B081|nr:TetR/AcrR family transcriptional regulator C-terminal domain-containing protein [Nonomuraea lactucae]